MASSNNLNALFADAELPFGHPGRKFDDTPAYFEDFDDRYEPPQVDPPEEGMVHYDPGGRPLCGTDSHLTVHTEDPHQVAGCHDCPELVAEDLTDNHHYTGHCLHRRKQISAQGGVAWRRAVRRPCLHCGKAGW